MPIANITYQEVVNEVKNWIKSNCKNISSYSSISGVFKAGWSKTDVVVQGDTTRHNSSGSKKTKTCTISLKSGGVVQYSGSDVDSDMNTFCSNYCNLSGSKLNQNIPEDEFYHFIQDMLSFISTKCLFVSSQYDQGTRYLIYDKTQNSFTNTYKITSDKDERRIYALDVTELMKTMLDNINHNLRCAQCVYSYSLSA